MLIYLVDDRGANGEYAEFLYAHRESLPKYSLEVFTCWSELLEAIHRQSPGVILADMRFDLIPTECLYGDIDALANTDRFCGNKERAEAQIRGMQGLIICRALRENNISVPIILFASLAPQIKSNVSKSLAPIRIIEGLMINEVRASLREIIAFNPQS